MERLAPGGTDRPEAGQVSLHDLASARSRLASGGDGAHRKAHRGLDELQRLLRQAQADAAVYLEVDVFRLPQPLRSVAIEIDFVFGDQDGIVSTADLGAARLRYRNVRGPVGWNRLLSADEVERRLHPSRVLQQARGERLIPEDWMRGVDPTGRLERLVDRLGDEALARTYADAAAHLAIARSTDENGSDTQVLHRSLLILGAEIVRRDSVRPTLSDVARIGCEAAPIRALLKAPVDMSRRLRPDVLFDPYLPER